MFGYYPNASKTHLIVKQEYVQSAKGLFDGSGITVIADGDRYLGAAIGTRTYIEQYVKNKISEFIGEVKFYQHLHLPNLMQHTLHSVMVSLGNGLTLLEPYLTVVNSSYLLRMP